MLVAYCVQAVAKYLQTLCCLRMFALPEDQPANERGPHRNSMEGYQAVYRLNASHRIHNLCISRHQPQHHHVELSSLSTERARIVHNAAEAIGMAVAHHWLHCNCHHGHEAQLPPAELL